MYGHHIEQEKDQPGKVANPAHGQLNRENNLFPCCLRSSLRIWSHETGSAVPSRKSLLIFIKIRLDLVLTGFLPSSAVVFIYLFKTTIIRHRVSPEFIGPSNCIPMAFTAKSPPAQGK